jgi:hypothetical protein
LTHGLCETVPLAASHSSQPRHRNLAVPPPKPSEFGPILRVFRQRVQVLDERNSGFLIEGDSIGKDDSDCVGSSDGVGSSYFVAMH